MTFPHTAGTKFIFTQPLNADFKDDYGYQEYHLRQQSQEVCAAHCMDQARCQAYQYSAGYNNIGRHGNCLLFAHQNIKGGLYRDAHVYLKVEDMSPATTYTAPLNAGFTKDFGYTEYRVGQHNRPACAAHCSSQSRCKAYQYSAGYDSIGRRGNCLLFDHQDAAGPLSGDRYVYLKVKEGSCSLVHVHNNITSCISSHTQSDTHARTHAPLSSV